MGSLGSFLEGALFGDTYLDRVLHEIDRGVGGLDTLVQKMGNVGMAKLLQKPGFSHDELEGLSIDVHALYNAAAVLLCRGRAAANGM